MKLEEDPAYQLVFRASGYLLAARIIVSSGDGHPALRAPIAHLLAHGIEVLFKHVLLLHGKTVAEIKKDFGHSIIKMWEAPELEETREFVLEIAETAWRDAKNSGQFVDDFSEEPKGLIEEYLRVLDRLHTTESNYALRYVAKSGEAAPNPRFLLDTFIDVEDRLRSRFLISDRARQYD